MTFDDVAVIILAAGRSERFGGDDKLLAPLNGKPLAAHVADIAAGLPAHSTVAVIPPGNEARADLFARNGIEPIMNTSVDDGQGVSLANGIAHFETLPVEGALILLADMPFVTASHVGALVNAIGEADAAASRSNGVLHPPVLFSRRVFARLRGLEGDGAGKATLKDLENVVPVDMPPDEAADIDTPDALARYSGD